MLDHDGLISSSKLFLLGDFFEDFCFAVEFVDLGLLQSLSVEGLDVFDLG